MAEEHVKNTDQQTATDTHNPADDPEFKEFLRKKKTKKRIAEMREREEVAVLLDAGLEKELHETPDILENEKWLADKMETYKRKVMASEKEEKEVQDTRKQQTEEERRRRAAQKPPDDIAGDETLAPDDKAKVYRGMGADAIRKKRENMTKSEALFVSAYGPKRKKSG